MNFHKTIGFLATLLLTLGLGVPDSYAQTPAVSTVDVVFTLADGNTVTLNDTAGSTAFRLSVTVTLDAAAPTGGASHVVTLSEGDSHNSAFTLADLSLGASPQLTVNITDGNTSGTATHDFVYNPQTDDDTEDEIIAIKGESGGKEGTSPNFTISDEDIGLSAVAVALTLASDGSTVTLSDMADITTFRLSVTVTVEGGATVPTGGLSYDVTLSEGDNHDSAFTLTDLGLGASPQLTVNVAAGATSGTATHDFVYDPQTDDDTEDEIIAIKGESHGQMGTSADFTIDDSDIGVSAVAVALTLASDGSTVQLNDSAGSTAFRLSVTVTSAAAAPAGGLSYVVTLSEGDNHDSAFTLADLGLGVSPQLTVNVAAGATSGTATHDFFYDPQGDAGTEDEIIAIKGESHGQMGTSADFTIDDSDIGVSAVAVALTLADGSTVQLNDSAGSTAFRLSVTVTSAAAAPAGGLSYVVTLSEGDNHDSAFTLADLGLGASPQLTVNITDGNTSGIVNHDFLYDPQGDAGTEDEIIAIKGESGGQDGTSADFTINDVAPAPAALTSIAFSPATLSVTEGATLDITVTLTVTADAGAATSHNVTLSAAGATLDELGITSPVAVSVASGASSGTAKVPISYTAMEDDNAVNETIIITGMAGGQSSTVTLTVADNDESAVTGIKFSTDMLSVDEGATLATTVTLTVTADAGPAQTVSVDLSSSMPLPLGTINSPVTVSIPAGASSGMKSVPINYTAPEDDDNTDNEMIVITATVGTMSDELTLTVADNDAGAVTSVEFLPDMLSLTEGMAFIGTATVKVNVVAGAAQDHEVALSVDSGMLSDIGIMSSPVAVSVAAGASSGTADVAISYTPPTDADLDDEMITVTGMTGGKSGTLTLNVDDNTQSMGTITVSTSLESIRENSRTRNVDVTATLPSAPGAGNTVVVDVTVTGGTAPMSTQISISGTATSGTATVAITPVNDEVFTTSSITVTGSVTGYRSGMATIDVVDDDASMGTLSVTAAPPSLTMGSGAQTVVLTVKVVLASPDTENPGSLVVNVATDKGTLSANTVTITSITKHVDHDPATRKADGTAKVNLNLTEAEINAGGTINVTASADMYDSGTRAIPIRNRDGADVQGYRLVVIKPAAAGGWAIDANHQVEVNVMRVGSVAYPWTDFESIKVSVRDTAHAGHVIDAVTAADFNDENGTITFTESGSRGDVVWKGNDTILFRIQIHAHNNDDPSSNGQYLGAYVTAEFNVGGTTTTLSNRDSDKSVYPSNPGLVDEANRYVGDGKLFKVDNLKPSNAAIASVNLTNADGEPLTVAKVGDEVRVAIAVKGDVLFRESGMRAQIQPQDGKGTYQGRTYTAGQVAQITKTINFTAAQVIAAADDSLRASWKITEGFFKYKTDDFVDFIGPRGTVFEADNTIGRVLVAVKDQAGNWSGSKVTTFDADSRRPKVSILYPSAAPDSIYEHTHPLRFSGAVESIVEGQNVDAHLNPLAIVVDEDISALKVFAVGADTLDISSQIPGNVIGDSTAVYDTSTLSSPKKDEDDDYEGTEFVPSSANRAGTEIELVVLATDQLGNTTPVTISGVTHDASPPVVTDWFPKNSLLPDGQINDATPPIFTLSEDVDSIAVTFEGSDGSEVTKQRGGLTTKGEDSIDISGALKDEVSYDMTIFVRDLAGNVFITPADSSSNMRFNAEFDNPVANRFNISTETDSVIAGQANMLTIQAEDHDAGADVTRSALTYKNAVRISAEDASGGAATSVWFEGEGVDDNADNPDGEAMLSAADWKIGKRTVAVKSNMAVGSIKIVVEHQGGTAGTGFSSESDPLYVGAADFAGFEITTWEEGVEGPAPEIWGDYILRVVPVDRHGNASVRAFKAGFDSLDVLDTRVKDNALEYKDGIDVEIVGVPAIEDFALLILSIGKEGASYDLVAPDNRRSQTVQVRVVNTALKEGDTRSQNIRASAKFKISAPLEPVLTLWVPGSNVNEAGNNVEIPADAGTVTVTVRAEGFNAGDMVTFTRNGEDVATREADDDGNASLMITATMASSTTVSASNGVYKTKDELTVTFVEAPADLSRKKFADANGDPVYLVSLADMTVGSNDYALFSVAWGKTRADNPDDQSVFQSDVNDDGTVNSSDYALFVTSWGKTAVGPAAKPIVLLPGVNENAEFSLSLGSERVVAGELVAVDVSLANVAALMAYGFTLNYETDKFEFVSAAPADEDLLKSTGGETPLFHHIAGDGQVEVVNSVVHGTAVSGGGDIVRFVFRVLREFEDNARFEIAEGLVFDPSQLQNPAVVAGVLELQSTPREFALRQNFPNPFNPDTTIKYDLAESADVTLQIYNVLGQVVRTLVASEAQNAGRYQIRWNGMDDRGVPVSSGIYFYQISAGGKFSDVRKLMLLK